MIIPRIPLPRSPAAPFTVGVGRSPIARAQPDYRPCSYLSDAEFIGMLALHKSRLQQCARTWRIYEAASKSVLTNIIRPNHDA